MLSIVQRRFDEILVDEFQDINRLDFALIKQIAEKCRLVVTGDDDQAIYGFRGCSPNYIIDLAKHLERDIHSIELRSDRKGGRMAVAPAERAPGTRAALRGMRVGMSTAFPDIDPNAELSEC
jgi:DNA helicase II / ATP-dependent DNA helicase PcrA